MESGEMLKISDKKFKIIYADPPWPYDNADSGLDGLASDQYDAMTMDEIKGLPVAEIADKDCILFLWVTFPHLQEGLDTIKAWGFKFTTVAFVWEKLEKNSFNTKKYGLGYYTRSNCEIVLVGKKGKFERKDMAVQQVIRSTISRHSEKPDEIRKRIVKLCGDIPRIELFARTIIHGWDVWGNDKQLLLKPLEVYYD